MSKAWPIAPIRAAYRGLFDGPHATPKPSDEGPVFLGIGNITEDGHLDLAQTKRISEDEFPRWTKRVLPQPGDIVFTYEATLNRYAIVPNGFRGCLGRRLALIRPNPAAVNTRWLHYYFFGPEWRAVVAANTLSGATVERIPLSSFPDFPIRLPDLQTQRRIASILSAYDDLIENNTRRIAILEEMARRIYEEWFVRFRFPGHEQVKMVESELGLIPEGWSWGCLRDVAEDVRESVHPEAVAPDTPYVGLEHIPRRSIALAEWGFASEVQSTKLSFVRGDILFGKIRPYFHKVAVAPVDGIASSDAIVIRARESKWYPLVLATVSSDAFVAEATQSANGTKMPRANWNVLLSYKLPKPTDEVLAKFNEIMLGVVDFVRVATLKNRNLRATRDLLLPKLISGELDVSKLPEPTV